jgi:hypothetical protein
MPFQYMLPTTSLVSFSKHYSSPVYPSLPLIVTRYRGIARNLLKAHKRLPSSQQSANLPQIQAALESYLPYLFFLQSSLHLGDVLPSDIASTPIKTSWRATLTTPPFPGSSPKRVEREGLDYEIAFTLSVLAYTYTLTSRSQLQSALVVSVEKDKKQSLLNQAIKGLLLCSSIFTYSLSLPRTPNSSTWPSDLHPQVLSALSSLCLADATLLAVTKQDPYPSYLALTTSSGLISQDKGAGQLDYLNAPLAPPTGVRALLLARICIAAATHAERALGLLPKQFSDSQPILPELGKYLDCLQRVARAKACRFLAIDAETSSRIGEGIGWIVLARSFLSPFSSSTPTLSTSKLKRDFMELRESRALKKGDTAWDVDAGLVEESSVLTGLEENWRKQNDRVFFQPVEEMATLAARIPSGREVHSVKEWIVPEVDTDTRRSLMSRIEEVKAVGMEWDDSADEDGDEISDGKKGSQTTMPGAFVETKNALAASVARDGYF